MENKDYLEQKLKEESAKKWVNNLFMLFERLAKMKDRYDFARKNLEKMLLEKAL